jgi:potassium-transporting ATPase KdpC subunit
MNLLKQTIMCLLILTVITGVVYPLVVTGIAQLIFPHQANGSLIFKNSNAVGSSLIGQSFNSPKYFWSRPSATSPMPYNGANSSGSNLGPLNPALIENIKARAAKLKSADPENKTNIPVDLATSSGSGLDPDISSAAAEYQISRVAKARDINEIEVRNLVVKFSKGRQLGVLGEPRINVLELNLALDALEK